MARFEGTGVSTFSSKFFSKIRIRAISPSSGHSTEGAQRNRERREEWANETLRLRDGPNPLERLKIAKGIGLDFPSIGLDSASRRL
jgi:hypothetical protein